VDLVEAAVEIAAAVVDHVKINTGNQEKGSSEKEYLCTTFPKSDH
jgi:hypothetical protein